MIDKYLKVKDIKLHYFTYGRGEPLIFFHGHRADGLRFKKITDILAKRYQVFIPDLPGFGKSEELKISHSLENFFPYLEEFIKKLKINNFILSGVSLGASLALLFLQKTSLKIKKIVLFGPVVDKSFYKFPRIYIFSAKIILKLFLLIPFISAFFDKIIANDFLFAKINWLTLPKNLRKKEIVDYEVRQWCQMSTKVWAEVNLSMLDFKLANEKLISLPALFILADLDKYFNVLKTREKLQQLFPKSEIIILENVPHVKQGEIPDKLLKKLSYIFDKI